MLFFKKDKKQNDKTGLAVTVPELIEQQRYLPYLQQRQNFLLQQEFRKYLYQGGGQFQVSANLRLYQSLLHRDQEERWQVFQSKRRNRDAPSFPALC